MNLLYYFSIYREIIKSCKYFLEHFSVFSTILKSLMTLFRWRFYYVQHFCLAFFSRLLIYNFCLLTIFLWLLRQKVQMCFGWADWSDPRVGEELTWKNGGEGA